ncbi:MAG: T9SS type A sorting domain-containing protein [Chitinophagaceae bacterium]|nr:T9SS type A sorting domain-containing protein [Chitinophagaceae bacterium]
MKLNFTLSIILFVAGINSIAAQQLLQADQYFKKQHQATAKQRVPATGIITARPAGNNPVRQKCGFASYMERARARGYKEDIFENELKRLVQKRIETGQTAFTGTVTIPVIFHCVFRTGQALSPATPNLTAAMYQAQITQMNNDYANLSGSTYGVAADVRIRFCLALADTAGRILPEPGIDRINGTVRGWTNTNNLDEVGLQDYFDLTIKPASIWDPNSYFNVWTAAMDASQLLGYATFPSLSTLPGLEETETAATAGCVIAWQSVGSIATPGDDPFFGFGRTLTHESGHFFGLRHIWGDNTCGEDYCGDTPPQDDATSGCPATGTLNNCAPSGPKMFENYMDYTDDACVNTFTAAQALRCQAAMDNSPRRFGLISSKACQARAGNAIQFGAASQYAVLETGVAGNCPNSKSYSFNVYVSDKATGAATVTFTTSGGTATQNVDYSISPASVTYTANDNAAKTVTVTINDDQVAELSETIILGYTISGTGVIAGPDKQTLSLTVVDDDVSGIAVNDAVPVKTVLSENFNTSANIPTGWTTSVYDDGSSSYTPNQWVVSANGGTGTTGNAAHITRSTSTKVNQYSNTNISDAYLFTPLLDASGLSNLNLSFKWRCLGEVGYDEGYLGYIPEGQAVDANNVIYFDTLFSGLSAATAARTATLNLPISLSNKKFYIVFNWFNDETIGSNPPFTIDDVTLTGKNFSVATSVDADTAFLQYTGQTVNFYSRTSTANRLIATIANPDQNLGCVAAGIQSAGTGKTLLTTQTGSYFRTNKVIRLTPAVANSTVHYQGTLYFSATELSPAWTGTEIPALKILKVKEGVGLSGIITSADAELITPIFVDAAENGYYSYTGNFTGLSQFMLVSQNTVVPVNLLSFEARASRNSIALSWATAQELNNKGFTVERSTNGVNFESVGWVSGQLNSSARLNYTFNDNFVQPNTVYYYRLRQVDINNREDLSSVRQARISKQGVTVTVSPVPAKDVMNVYINGSTQTAAIKLVNAQGQLVKSWSNVNAGNSAYGLDVSNLPPGIYILNVTLPEQNIVKKIMIQK